MPQSFGIILFHKHPTSARVCFLCSAEKSVVFATKIPDLATLIDEQTVLEKEELVTTHPAMALRELEQRVELSSGDMALVKDFRVRLDVPGEITPIYLAQFKSIDPPFEAVKNIEAKFIAITEARGLPSIELQLLQKSYQYIMEG